MLLSSLSASAEEVCSWGMMLKKKEKKERKKKKKGKKIRSNWLPENAGTPNIPELAELLLTQIHRMLAQISRA